MTALRLCLLCLAIRTGESLFLSTNNLTWTEAQAFCKNNQSLLIPGTKAGFPYPHWTGYYHRLSDWIHVLGCYDNETVEDMGISASFVLDRGSVGLCQERCGSRGAFALKNTSCLCLGSMPQSRSLPSSRCGWSCSHDDEGHANDCGGSDTFNVYSATPTKELDSANTENCMVLGCYESWSQVHASNCSDDLGRICNTQTSSSFSGMDDFNSWNETYTDCKKEGSYMFGNFSVNTGLSGARTLCKRLDDIMSNTTENWLGAARQVFLTKDRGHSEAVIIDCQACWEESNCDFVKNCNDANQRARAVCGDESDLLPTTTTSTTTEIPTTTTEIPTTTAEIPSPPTTEILSTSSETSTTTSTTEEISTTTITSTTEMPTSTTSEITSTTTTEIPTTTIKEMSTITTTIVSPNTTTEATTTTTTEIPTTTTTEALTTTTTEIPTTTTTEALATTTTEIPTTTTTEALTTTTEIPTTTTAEIPTTTTITSTEIFTSTTKEIPTITTTEVSSTTEISSTTTLTEITSMTTTEKSTTTTTTTQENTTEWPMSEIPTTTTLVNPSTTINTTEVPSSPTIDSVTSLPTETTTRQPSPSTPVPSQSTTTPSSYGTESPEAQTGLDAKTEKAIAVSVSVTIVGLILVILGMLWKGRTKIRRRRKQGIKEITYRHFDSGISSAFYDSIVLPGEVEKEHPVEMAEFGSSAERGDEKVTNHVTKNETLPTVSESVPQSPVTVPPKGLITIGPPHKTLIIVKRDLNDQIQRGSKEPAEKTPSRDLNDQLHRGSNEPAGETNVVFQNGSSAKKNVSVIKVPKL